MAHDGKGESSKSVRRGGDGGGATPARAEAATHHRPSSTPTAALVVHGLMQPTADWCACPPRWPSQPTTAPKLAAAGTPHEPTPRAPTHARQRNPQAPTRGRTSTYATHMRGRRWVGDSGRHRRRPRHDTPHERPVSAEGGERRSTVGVLGWGGWVWAGPGGGGRGGAGCYTTHPTRSRLLTAAPRPWPPPPHPSRQTPEAHRRMHGGRARPRPCARGRNSRPTISLEAAVPSCKRERRRSSGLTAAKAVIPTRPMPKLSEAETATPDRRRCLYVQMGVPCSGARTETILCYRYTGEGGEEPQPPTTEVATWAGGCAAGGLEAREDGSMRTGGR